MSDWCLYGSVASQWEREWELGERQYETESIERKFCVLFFVFYSAHCVIMCLCVRACSFTGDPPRSAQNVSNALALRIFRTSFARAKMIFPSCVMKVCPRSNPGGVVYVHDDVHKPETVSFDVRMGAFRSVMCKKTRASWCLPLQNHLCCSYLLPQFRATVGVCLGVQIYVYAWWCMLPRIYIGDGSVHGLLFEISILELDVRSVR